MWGLIKDWIAVSFKPSPYMNETKPAYDFSNPLEVPRLDVFELFPVPLPIPLETEKMSEAVNLDAMTPAELTAFIESKEKAHKDSQKALRALLRAKITLAPKVVTEAPAVG